MISCIDNEVRYELLHEDDYDIILELIKARWNQNHIFTKCKDLFIWQYKGYGMYKENGQPVLFFKDKIAGFRLIIPSEIRYLDNYGNVKISPLCVGAMYFVVPELQGKGLGKEIQKIALNDYENNYFNIASNLKTSNPMFRKWGYNILDESFRYVATLSEGYRDLLVNENSNFLSSIIDLNNVSLVKPIQNPNAKDIATVWERGIYGCNIICLNRPVDYWQWRYLDSPFYKYFVFGGIEEGGYIIARISKTYNDEMQELDTKIFRILEIVPLKQATWKRVEDKIMSILILRSLKWAKNQGCCAAEFYCSSSIFHKTLSSSGFHEVNYNVLNKHLDIASYYEPLAKSKRLSNVSIHINGLKDINFEDTYFTLSDCDQDRPNLI